VTAIKKRGMPGTSRPGARGLERVLTQASSPPFALLLFDIVSWQLPGELVRLDAHIGYALDGAA
jgi:hypothetical protein